MDFVVALFPNCSVALYFLLFVFQNKTKRLKNETSLHFFVQRDPLWLGSSGAAVVLRCSHDKKFCISACFIFIYVDARAMLPSKLRFDSLLH